VSGKPRRDRCRYVGQLAKIYDDGVPSDRVKATARACDGKTKRGEAPGAVPKTRIA
jgi:hypothetical protein